MTKFDEFIYRKGFVDGVLLDMGTFVWRETPKKATFFRITCSSKDEQRIKLINSIIDFLNVEFQIRFRVYQTKTSFVWQISERAMLYKMLKYCEDNLLIKKKHQDYVKEKLIEAGVVR